MKLRIDTAAVLLIGIFTLLGQTLHTVPKPTTNSVTIQEGKVVIPEADKKHYDEIFTQTQEELEELAIVYPTRQNWVDTKRTEWRTNKALRKKSPCKNDRYYRPSRDKKNEESEAQKSETQKSDDAAVIESEDKTPDKKIVSTDAYMLDRLTRAVGDNDFISAQAIIDAAVKFPDIQKELLAIWQQIVANMANSPNHITISEKAVIYPEKEIDTRQIK